MSGTGRKLRRVTLERTACYGPCPIYKVIVDSRGRFRWIGEYFVPVVGTHSGSIERPLFRALSDMIDGFGFFEWDDDYSEDVTDMPSTILTVERPDAIKTVHQNGTDRPMGLQAIAAMIDGMIAPALWQIEWEASLVANPEFRNASTDQS